MKICFYCDSIFSFGGVQHVLAKLAGALSQKHQVTIITRDAPEKEMSAPFDLKSTSIRFRYLHYLSLPWYEFLPCKFYSFLYKKVLPQNHTTTRWYALSSFPWSHRKLLLQFLQEDNYDIIIGVHVYPSFQIASLKKHLTSKLIGWLHNSVDAFFHFPNLWLWKGEKRFKYQMEPLDKIIVLTHDDQKWYHKEMNLETETMYNPLTIQPEGKGDARFKKFLGIGRLTPQMKGFDILIEAFALFAQQDTEWTLEIVGEGEEEGKLRELIVRHGLEQRVAICPFTQQISKHYSSASVFVLSSRWEGFGLVLLEAMSYKLPIIASDLPITREWLKNKGNTLIFKNGDPSSLAKCMLEISKRTNWTEMEEISYQIAEELSLPKVLNKWEHLLADVISSSTSREETRKNSVK